VLSKLNSFIAFKSFVDFDIKLREVADFILRLTSSS